MLTNHSGAPILPIGFYVLPEDTVILKGRLHDQKTFARWQVRGCCYVQIGKPWRIKDIISEDIGHLKFRDITDRMMVQMADLVQLAKCGAAVKQYGFRSFQSEIFSG